RLQNQERITKQIVEALETTLNPKGVGVVLKAEHLCVKLRGVEKQNCKIVTLAFAGSFTDDARTRDEFFRLIEPRFQLNFDTKKIF
ncbi:MAG: GTP cyclohydrolase I, partial [Myxococcales bacterium]|nr:GTP cyclohydrolase I [Myxococcales bacterium]